MSKKLWIASDLHLGHCNILKFCPNRSFKNIDDHDDAYIENHNKMVSDEDVVVFLGDFAFRNKRPTKEYIKALNGQLFILFGNHDESAIKCKHLFSGFWGRPGHNEIVEYKWFGKKYIFCHYPMLSWNARSHDRMNFFGHVHSHTTRPFHCQPNSCDVGVDAWNHGPVLLNDAIMRARSTVGKLSAFDKYDNVV